MSSIYSDYLVSNKPLEKSYIFSAFYNCIVVKVVRKLLIL